MPDGASQLRQQREGWILAPAPRARLSKRRSLVGPAGYLGLLMPRSALGVVRQQV